MTKLGFCTAVRFWGDQPKTCRQSWIETVDSYLYLGGKKAYVIPGHTQSGAEGAVLAHDSPAFLITALKVVSYFTIVVPTIMLIAKAVLRSIYPFHIVDAKQKLEKGIDIPQQAIAKIERLMQKIENRQEDPEIVWYASKNRVFRLNSEPHLIFKALDAGDRRFENMIKAQEVCLAHQLELLIVPHAQKFCVGGRMFIAEEYLTIQQGQSVQEKLYAELPGLNKTTKQLVTFIAKTGFSDVEWRNMPIVDDAPAFEGSRRIALIDLEEMDSPSAGIFGGGGGRRGLIRCLSSETLIDIALGEARHFGVKSPFATSAEIKARRMDEIQNHERLQQFYSKNGILENPQKPIQISDLETLELDLNEKATLLIPEARRNGSDNEATIEYQQKPITLREAALDIVAQINEQISKAPLEASPKQARYIRLDTNRGTLNDYLHTGRNGQQISCILSDEQENETWLARVINALVAKGYLFRLSAVNNHGYFIQA